ncbi:MAG: autotransporter outer membrane beta-barrel domain-containing protein [Thermoguttaceae bacterium]
MMCIESAMRQMRIKPMMREIQIESQRPIVHIAYQQPTKLFQHNQLMRSIMNLTLKKTDRMNSAAKLKVPRSPILIFALLLAVVNTTNVFGAQPLANSARTANQREIAKYIDRASSGALTENQKVFFNELYAMNPADVSGALNQASGSARANSLMIGMSSPWTQAFDRLQLRAPDARTSHGMPGIRRGGMFSSHTGSSNFENEIALASYMNGEYVEGEYIVGEYVDGEYTYDQILNGELIQGEIIGNAQFFDSSFSGETTSEYVDPNDFEQLTPQSNVSKAGVNRKLPALTQDEVEVRQVGYYQYRGQCGAASCGGMSPLTLWATPYYNTADVSSDGNSAKYGISRTGFSIGGHKAIGKHGAFGFMLGYSAPELSQVNNRITANDYTFGFYGGTLIAHKYEFKGYLGWGTQDYTTSRWVNYGNYSEYVRGRTSGGTFAGSFQLAKPIYGYGLLTRGGVWRPMVAIDINGMHQDRFTESGDSIAYNYDKATLDKSFFRIGLDREIEFNYLKVRAGIAYSTQLGGDSAPQSVERLIGQTGDGRITEYGVNIGRDFFNANVGMEYYLNSCRTKSIFGGYSVSSSSRDTDQTSSIGIRWMM